MKTDALGQTFLDSNEICELLYRNPDLDISGFVVLDPDKFNQARRGMYANWPELRKYIPEDISVEDFDSKNQNSWHMPEEYQNLDIAQWILDQCQTDAELQRVGEELLLYHERDLFNLLRFMKYLVDTLRKNNVLWGVGRGSSVASYILYLIGVHRINSMYWDLDPHEFLR